MPCTSVHTLLMSVTSSPVLKNVSDILMDTATSSEKTGFLVSGPN